MKKPLNQHHYLENVTIALNAMKKDDIKLVNIGTSPPPGVTGFHGDGLQATKGGSDGSEAGRSMECTREQTQRTLSIWLVSQEIQCFQSEADSDGDPGRLFGEFWRKHQRVKDWDPGVGQKKQSRPWYV